VIRQVSIADQAPTIPILVHMIETINNIMCRSRQMFNEIGREPTAEELAQKLDGKPFVAGKLRLAIRRTVMQEVNHGACRHCRGERGPRRPIRRRWMRLGCGGPRCAETLDHAKVRRH